MTKMNDALALRFGDGAPEALDLLSAAPFPQQLAARRSHRRFKDEPVDGQLIRSLCALALCAPTKSDLQQRDIIIVEDATLRAELDELLAEQRWIAGAPSLLVFCANNRRQRLLHEWRKRELANDHLDAFFNAAVDAGIALTAFMMAAESIGLGCCPISAIRNDAAKVSELLKLPDHVYPVAGLGLGWPASDGELSLRLPLDVTVHTDSYTESDLRETVEAYDRRRAEHQPYKTQRFAKEYGEAAEYGWSEDKARQYSRPERDTFGAFIRAKGFDLR
jgi:nitroreductase